MEKMYTISDKITYLQMIQNLIQRMATNSFQLKGWAITLVGVTAALTVDSTNTRMRFWLLLPLFVFWFLDAYYLRLERVYRLLYRHVATCLPEQIDFDLDPAKVKTDAVDSCKICYFSCLFSKTEFLFYVPFAVFVWIFKTCL